MSDKAVVARLPECDIHAARGEPEVTARYDGKTTHGPWAHMCSDCFSAHGVGLGTGRGQELVVDKEGQT